MSLRGRKVKIKLDPSIVHQDPLAQLAETFAALRRRKSVEFEVVESQGGHSYTVSRWLKKRTSR